MIYACKIGRFSGWCFLIGFFFLSPICTQDALAVPRAEWSRQLEENNKMPYLKIIGSAADGFFVLRSNISLVSGRDKVGFRTRKYQLQYFSEAMVLKMEQDLSAPVEDGHITDITMLGDEVLLIYYTMEKGRSLYKFFASRVNKSGAVEGSPVFLDELSAESIDDENKPGIIFSKNKSRLLFSYRKYTKDKDQQEVRCLVMDSVLQPLYKQVIDIPFSFKKFTPLNTLLTNEGSVYLLGLRYLSEKKSRQPDEMFYHVFGFNAGKNKTLSREIRMDGRFLTDASIADDPINRQLVVAGFYSDKTTYSTAGVFYFALEEDSLASTKVYHSPFTTAYLQKFVSNRQNAKTRELVNYSIDRLILRRDGGAVIAAEAFYRTSRSYWDYYTQTMVYHTYYHFGNIMILSVNPDGSMLWSNLISKDQNSVDDGGYYSSYASAISGGEMFAIYNKYIDERSSVLITTVDGVGNQQTDVLFNELDRVSVLSRASRQLDEETLIIPAYKEKKFYFLKLIFD